MFELVPLTPTMADGMVRWVAETSLVASILALVALLGGRFRRLGPAARHALWLVVLVKLMTPPLVHWPWSRPWPLPISSVANRLAPDRTALSRSADDQARPLNDLARFWEGEPPGEACLSPARTEPRPPRITKGH
jgi:hypothetical protein